MLLNWVGRKWLAASAASMLSSAFVGGIAEAILLMLIVLVLSHSSVLAAKAILGRYLRYFMEAKVTAPP